MSRPLCVNQRDRYYCRRCKCEVAFGPPGGPHRASPDVLTQEGMMRDPTGNVPADMRIAPSCTEPVAFDEACECDCHTAWRLTWGIRRPAAPPAKRTRKKPAA